MTFDEYSLVARAGGAPLLAVSRDGVSRGAASVERIANAASPVVHRVLVAAFSTLSSTGMFELSLEGVVTRAISVDAPAETMQNVRIFFVRRGGGWCAGHVCVSCFFRQLVYVTARIRAQVKLSEKRRTFLSVGLICRMAQFFSAVILVAKQVIQDELNSNMTN